MVAFIGPSGCGKSTFLRSINRLNDLIPGCPSPASCGSAVKTSTTRVDLVSLRREVGLVFQKPNPFPETIYDNIAYGRACRASATAKRSTAWSKTASAKPHSGKRRAATRLKQRRLACPGRGPV